MDCSRISEQLGFYIDGTLDERMRDQVEAHLEGCAECRAELASLKMLIGVAGQIDQIDPPGSLRARIAAVTTGRKDYKVRVPVLTRLRNVLSPKALWASGFAGAAVMAVIAFVALSHPVAPVIRSASKTTIPHPTIRPTINARVQTIASLPIASTHIVAAHVESKHVAHRRSLVVARKPAESSIKIIAKVKIPGVAHQSRSASATQPVDDIVPDGTTVGEAMTPSDIQQPSPETSDTSTKLGKTRMVEVESSPAVKRDNTEQWMKQMKEQAAMHLHEHNPAGMSLINARF